MLGTLSIHTTDWWVPSVTSQLNPVEKVICKVIYAVVIEYGVEYGIYMESNYIIGTYNPKDKVQSGMHLSF